MPLSIVVLAVPAVVGAVRLLLATQRSFDFFGDEAVLESAVRHVGRQLVGPYSRFGFHQPGPAYYWLQAPFYWATGKAAPAMFLGAFCINLGSALGCVTVVRRFLGEVAARWSALVVGLLLVCLTPALLANPWNPYVLALPVLLTLLLVAGVSRSSVAAGGALVVGSCVVQTHVAAAATLGASGAAALTIGLLSRRRGRPAAAGAAPESDGLRRRPWMVPAVATSVILALMWAPPLIEQWTRSPGNLRTLAQFFRTPHPQFDEGIDHSLPTATGEVASQLTVMPFGHDRNENPIDGLKVLLSGLGLLSAAVVAVVGWRRQQAVIATLGALSVVGPLVAVWSATRIVGEPFPYLLVWTSPLLLPGLIGGGALLSSRSAGATGRIPRSAGRGLFGACCLIGVGLTVTMARNPLVPYGTATEPAAVASLTEPWLRARGVDQVRVGIAQHDRWPLATGVALRLDKDGFTPTFDQQWSSLFGEHFRPTGHELATVWLADRGATPPPEVPSTRLGVVGDASIWVSPS